jgi:ABC-type oligopeptide transport system substrate-binding subunit
MKRRLIITAMLLLGSVAAFSQSKLSEEQKKEFRAQLKTYQDKLNLSEDQASKMEVVNLAYFEGLADLKSRGGSRMAKYKMYKGLNDERDFKVKQILDAGQYKIYLQQQKEMKEEMRERRN